MNFKQKHFIDFHKGITPLFIIILLTSFQQWDNLLATIYLALHGTYGLLWITKSQIYPDKQWESKSSIGYGLFIWLGLSLYWISPVIIITEYKFESFNNSSVIFAIDGLISKKKIIKLVNFHLWQTLEQKQLMNLTDS